MWATLVLLLTATKSQYKTAAELLKSFRDSTRAGHHKERLGHALKYVDDAHSAHFAIPKRWNYEGKESWTNAVIIRKHKLMVCTLPKVVSTQWRQMLRRLEGYEHNYLTWYPHARVDNGLTYIDSIPLDELRNISLDKSWTKVVFVRNPISRTLSGYLDKIVSEKEFRRLPIEDKMDEKTRSMRKFLSLIKKTRGHDLDCDEHWRRQSSFCGLRFIPYDFVGHFENIHEDSKLLLKQLGLWGQYGASGWGQGGDQPFLHQDKHTDIRAQLTNATDKVFQEFTPLTAKMLVDYYMEDFVRFGYPTDAYQGRSLSDPDNFVHNDPTEVEDKCVDVMPPAYWDNPTCESQLANTENCKQRREGRLPDGICHRTCGVCQPACKCRQFQVSGSIPQYTMMGKFLLLPGVLADNHPVYQNKFKQFLFYHEAIKDWMVGADYTKPFAGVRSVSDMLAPCPSAPTSWEHYLDEHGWVSVRITVACVPSTLFLAMDGCGEVDLEDAYYPNERTNYVSCCSKDGKRGARRSPELGGHCSGKMTHEDAETWCSKGRMRLCAPEELAATCYKGCGYDIQRVWTSKSIKQDIPPSPAANNAFRPHHTAEKNRAGKRAAKLRKKAANFAAKKKKHKRQEKPEILHREDLEQAGIRLPSKLNALEMLAIASSISNAHPAPRSRKELQQLVDKALEQYEADRQAGLPAYAPVSQSYQSAVTQSARTVAHQSGVTDDGVNYVDDDGNSLNLGRRNLRKR